jgi:hypothetical protein
MRKLGQLKTYPPTNNSTGWGAGSNDKKNEQPVPPVKTSALFAF